MFPDELGAHRGRRCPAYTRPSSVDGEQTRNHEGHVGPLALPASPLSAASYVKAHGGRSTTGTPTRAEAGGGFETSKMESSPRATAT